eukprot:TRINITY_DN33641_c0_g1_i2.p1 TRINITY_DN33641_c0_g1~~TRINITY_DN33641_c0_g1_i2.p1  ORF type:complete len:217 (+),score=13.72 TRINITY_DN33641_c0_g1_i2:185-835(+)
MQSLLGHSAQLTVLADCALRAGLLNAARVAFRVAGSATHTSRTRHFAAQPAWDQRGSLGTFYDEDNLLVTPCCTTASVRQSAAHQQARECVYRPADASLHESDASDSGRFSRFAVPSPEPHSRSMLDVSSGETVAMCGLGPLVVNADGSLSRLANWPRMTAIERHTIQQLICRRNRERLADFEARMQSQRFLRALRKVRMHGRQRRSILHGSGQQH